MDLLDLLVGAIVGLIAILGWTKFEQKQERETIRKDNVARDKAIAKQQQEASEALIRGSVDEDKAVQDPDSHDFTK